jgi:hypothetical protein
MPEGKTMNEVQNGKLLSHASTLSEEKIML